MVQVQIQEKNFMTKNNWSDYFSVEFTFEGVDFTCNASVLLNKDGEVVETSIFDLKAVSGDVRKLAIESAIREFLEKKT